VSVAGGGQNRAVAEDLLHLEQIDTGLDQVGCIAVAQAVRGDLFFIPQAATTLRKVTCTPPRSSGVVAAARAAVFKDVPDGATVAGAPARPHREWLKANANLQRLDGLREKVKQLERRLAELEERKT